MTYKLGSLFDGSGGFPLAGSLCGIVPAWASEVEPYPIAVTRSRFPHMKHLGDISKINGGEIEPVDIITFGSPCQDLSVAGKRAGLKHESNGDEETTRSGLFMEAVRIIKEMRRATDGRYPTFALWENVPGAFSSNKGEDFRVVLEELIKIVEPSCSVPPMPKGGWPYADAYMGDGWSLAYRVFDAQYWGVPQRRRRIHLVLDLRGERAGQVSFERGGVRGYFATGRTPWQAVARDAQDCAGADDRAGEGFDGYNGDLTGDVSATLSVNCGASTGWNGVIERRGGLNAAIGAFGFDRYNQCPTGEVCETLRTPGGGDNYPTVCYAIPYTLKIRSDCEGGGKGALIQTDKSVTLSTLNDQYLFQPVCSSGDVAGTLDASYYKGCGMRQGVEREYVVQPILDDQGGSQISVRTDGKSPTLRAEMHGNVPAVMEPVCVLASSAVNAEVTDGSISPCLMARAGTGGNQLPLVAVKEERLPAVAYEETYQKTTGPLMANSHPGSYSGQDAYNDMFVIGKEAPPIALDRAFYNQGQNAQYDPQFYTDGTVPTLVAKGHGAVAIRYIVRRLTPTECARLQGFADRWGDIDPKEDFTDEEYKFWLDVRNTHATVIGGKEAKEYTKAQMVTWYNRLLTDSSEYKMWGNGIALPPALYVMQGMEDALKGERNDESD